MKALERNIVLLGSPGVGKGAQATLLEREASIPHVSTGELLRREIAQKTPIGRRIGPVVERGGFADDETMLSLVTNALDQPACRDGIILDGFPRTVRQARLLDEVLVERGRRVHHAIYIDAPEATIIQRLSGRLVCPDCGATYHEEFAPPEFGVRCDRCRGELERRADDDPEHHAERLRAFREKTRPLIEYYREAGVLADVDGGASVRGVAQRIRRVLEASPLAAS